MRLVDLPINQSLPYPDLGCSDGAAAIIAPTKIKQGVAEIVDYGTKFD